MLLHRLDYQTWKRGSNSSSLPGVAVPHATPVLATDPMPQPENPTSARPWFASDAVG